jgi:phosphate transport system permease protein
MTVETAPMTTDTQAAPRTRHATQALIRKRYAAERRFRAYGVAAILFGLTFLVALFWTICSRGYTAFLQSAFAIQVHLDQGAFGSSATPSQSDLMMADYTKLANRALFQVIGVDPANKADARAASKLLSANADTQIRQAVLADPSLIGKSVEISLLADGNVDNLMKGHFDRSVAENRRQLSDKQLAWIDKAAEAGVLTKQFNTGIFTYGASSKPETAGVGVALVGSLYMMAIVLLISVPLGVAAAVYLEEFAPKNVLTDAIEVNINNLAAVPSIVFGLLGLAIFINFMGIPRSAALVGGLVLALMTLPTIIIATRAAIAAVPPSIREAALGVGASKMQSITHHVLPLAVPGILTGTIIGLAKALGETAPLLMIGMVAFVVDFPKTPLDSATALPVQIFMWATAAERGFVERTAGATMILLAFLICMNVTAVILRRRYERRW